MKTISLKKVSAVAVASLGFGLLSVVPANAANGPAIVVSSINLTTTTASPEVDVAVVVNMGLTIATQTVVTTDTFDITGAITSYPAGGQVGVAATTAVGTATQLAAPFASVALSGSSVTIGNSSAATSVTANTVTSSATVGSASFTFTPTKAGTYVLTAFKDGNQDGIIGASDVAQTVSITVAASATYSGTLSTAFITPGLGGTGAPTFVTTPAIATADVAVSQSAALNAAARASITVKLFDNTGTAMAAGKVTSISAEITGPGGVIVNADNVPTAPSCSTNSTAPNGRSVTFTSEDEINHVYVCSDGTAGVSTIKISVTDLLGVKTTLATKTVTFFGKVSKIVATGVLTNAASGGAALGNPAADRTGSTIVPSIIVRATDSAGNGVSSLTFTYVSSSTLVMTETLTCNEDVKSTANTSSSGGSGFYNCQVTSSSGAKSGDKATLTVRIANPADASGLTFLTSDVAFTIGGSATTGTETLSFDKASYAPGEAMVITRTAKDSTGNPVTDLTASPNYSFSKAAGGSAPAAGVYVKGVSATSTSAATSGIFAPVTPGSFIVTATAANGATITATATVTDVNAAASTAVNTRIDSLNAKIVALTALIAKIMKSLKIK